MFTNHRTAKILFVCLTAVALGIFNTEVY